MPVCTSCKCWEVNPEKGRRNKKGRGFFLIGDNASGTLSVKALKSLKLKKHSALWTGLLTHKIVRDALNLIQGISPLSFIDLRTASIYFRFVNQLKTLTQLCFQPACHPVKSTIPNPANKEIKYWHQDETRQGLKTIYSQIILLIYILLSLALAATF